MVCLEEQGRCPLPGRAEGSFVAAAAAAAITTGSCSSCRRDEECAAWLLCCQPTFTASAASRSTGPAEVLRSCAHHDCTKLPSPSAVREASPSCCASICSPAPSRLEGVFKVSSSRGESDRCRTLRHSEPALGQLVSHAPEQCSMAACTPLMAVSTFGSFQTSQSSIPDARPSSMQRAFCAEPGA